MLANRAFLGNWEAGSSWKVVASRMLEKSQAAGQESCRDHGDHQAQVTYCEIEKVSPETVCVAQRRAHPRTHTHHTCAHPVLGPPPSSLLHTLRREPNSIKRNEVQCSNPVLSCSSRDTTAFEAANMPICYCMQRWCTPNTGLSVNKLKSNKVAPSAYQSTVLPF